MWVCKECGSVWNVEVYEGGVYGMWKCVECMGVGVWECRGVGV